MTRIVVSGDKVMLHTSVFVGLSVGYNQDSGQSEGPEDIIQNATHIVKANFVPSLSLPPLKKI